MKNKTKRQLFGEPARCAAVLVCASLGLAACHPPPPPVEEVRPVRALIATATPLQAQDTYAGEVRPRYESSLGFRVAGKIQQRLANVGDRVSRGQVLAKLDPKDLALAEAGSRAALAAQKAQLEVERADLGRYKQLVADQVISQSAYDRQLSLFQAAQAQFDAAQAQLRQSSNQVEYALLRADHDGSIAAIEAEAGQVIAAGEAVVRLAWSGDTEIAASVPEDAVHRVRIGMPVEVSLWVDRTRSFKGEVRELSSSADPSTRTYSMRVSVPEAPPEMRLGMTASVRLPAATDAKLIHMPLTAVVERQGQGGVWVFDPKTGRVGFRALHFAGAAGNEMLVAEGLAEGEIVVTAGASYLLPGQKVRLMQTPSALAGEGAPRIPG